MSSREACAFCGARFGEGSVKRSGEHALPSWLLSVMPGAARVTHQRERSPGGPVDTWTADEIQIVASRSA